MVLMAYLIDRWIGDPRGIPHPVVWMGKGITGLEQTIRRFVQRDRSLRWAGVFLAIVIVGGSYLMTVALIKLFSWIHPWLGVAAEIWLISTTMAVKGLKDAGAEIYHLLKKQDLERARTSLSMVVGRDTKHLDEKEVVRGAVETVAENITDAVVSPLFFAAIGGAPLAMAYRAINTLDSMVGYKNERYRDLGMASARLDDLANYIPARIAGLVLIPVSYILKQDAKNAWNMIRRDARLHPSPNSGIMEAGVAGALGIQLGGINYYQGIPSERAKMGEPFQPLSAVHILATIRILKAVSLACLLLFVIMSALIHYAF